MLRYAGLGEVYFFRSEVCRLKCCRLVPNTECVDNRNGVMTDVVALGGVDLTW
jgi:hypothetical protein